MFHSAGQPVETTIETQKDNAILRIPDAIAALERTIQSLTYATKQQHDIMVAISNSLREIAVNDNIRAIRHVVQRIEAIQRDIIRKIPPETKSLLYNDDIHLLSNKAWDRIGEYIVDQGIWPRESVTRVITALMIAARNGTIYDDD